MPLSRRKWWILASLGIGTFMSALDGSVVNTILPIIKRDYYCGMDAVQWVVTVYLLIVSGLLLTFGRVGDLHGLRSVCIGGFAVFVASSALCGLAPSIIALVVSRGFQAIGAAMIFSSSPAILTANFPPEQLGQALGLQATMTYLGLASGPSLGGWLADTLGWPSVFYLNVPVGAAAIAACWWSVPHTPSMNHGESFDRLGATVFMAGLTMLLLALNQGHAWGWNSAATLALLATGLAALATFVAIQRRVRFPMLDLTLFRNRLFSAAVASAILNYAAVAAVTFLMPFYLILHFGWSTSHAGLIMTIQPLVMAVAAPLSGSVSDRLDGSRAPATLGMSILTIGLAWLACLNAESSWRHAAVGLAVVGLGTGIFISPNNSALMGAAPARRRGIAAGIMATARNAGMLFGVALAGAVVTTMQTMRFPLLDAFRVGFSAAATVAAVGAALTLVRGGEEPGG